MVNTPVEDGRKRGVGAVDILQLSFFFFFFLRNMVKKKKAVSFSSKQEKDTTELRKIAKNRLRSFIKELPQFCD